MKIPVQGTGENGSLDGASGRLLVRYARAVLRQRLLGEPVDPDLARAMTAPVFRRRAGVFVTLTTADGRLRGCIGSLTPSQSIVDGVQENAVNAALHDYRFPPVSAAELDDLRIEVSVLTDPQPLVFSSPEDLVAKLVPGRDGVILEAAGRRATFLPQVWEQLPRTEEFLGHLCRKAGLPMDAWRTMPVEIRVYQVEKFKEE